jgi:serine protein kinase
LGNGLTLTIEEDTYNIMSIKKQLLQQIKTQREESGKKKKFSGNLMDYIEMVEKDPDIVKSSHKRLHDAIEEHGSYVMPDSDSRKFKVFDGENIKIHKYFEGEFFGMETVIEKVMSFLS